MPKITEYLTEENTNALPAAAPSPILAPRDGGGVKRYFGVGGFGQSLIGWEGDSPATVQEQRRWPTFDNAGCKMATPGVQLAPFPGTPHDYTLISLAAKIHANIVTPTACARARGMYDEHQTIDADEYIFVPLYGALGGQPLAALLPPGGPNSNSGVFHDNGMAHLVRQAVHLSAKVSPNPFVVAFVMCVFGVSDHAVDEALFKAQLTDAENHLRSTVTLGIVDAPGYNFTNSAAHIVEVGDVKTIRQATGQTFEPWLFLLQSDVINGAATTPTNISTTANAMRTAARDNMRTKLIGPRYALKRWHNWYFDDISTMTWLWDAVHLRAHGGAAAGELAGEAWQIMQELGTGAATCCQIIDASVIRNAGNNELTFQVTRPRSRGRLVWDMKTIGPRRNGGFRLFDASNVEVEITHLEIISTDTLRLRYARGGTPTLLISGTTAPADSNPLQGDHQNLGTNLRLTGSLGVNASVQDFGGGEFSDIYHWLCLGHYTIS